MTFDRKTSPGYLTNHLARLFARAITGQIKPLGLSPGTFPAMLELWSEDGQSQRSLVERLNIEQATMANTLARMERDGLIRRAPDPNDGRSQQIWLTDKGRSLQAPAVELAAAVNAEALAPLDATERAEFVRLMQKLIAHLQETTRCKG